MKPGIYWQANTFENVAQAWHLDSAGIWRLDSECEVPDDFLNGLRALQSQSNEESK